jgi:hypothetical protein
MLHAGPLDPDEWSRSIVAVFGLRVSLVLFLAKIRHHLTGPDFSCDSPAMAISAAKRQGCLPSNRYRNILAAGSAGCRPHRRIALLPGTVFAIPQLASIE